MSTDYLTVMGETDMPQQTALYLHDETGWWKLYPAKDVALAQLRQDRLCMPWDTFKETVEKAIGGGVWSHEYANRAALIARIEGSRKGAVDPMRSLADVILRRTRVGRWVTQGRTYRTKALAMRSRVFGVMLT